MYYKLTNAKKIHQKNVRASGMYIHSIYRAISLLSDVDYVTHSKVVETRA